MAWKTRGLSILRQKFNARFMRTHSQNKHDLKTPLCHEVKVKNLFDEATVPEGPWAKGYAIRDAKDTKILIAGLITFFVTMIFLKNTPRYKGYPGTLF